MATSIESGTQAVRRQLATKKFNPEEPSAILQLAQAMHATIKAFLETIFSLYLCLGELDLAGLPQLFLDPLVEERPPMGYPRTSDLLLLLLAVDSSFSPKPHFLLLLACLLPCVVFDGFEP